MGLAFVDEILNLGSYFHFKTSCALFFSGFSLSDKTVKDYSAYKPYLMFFALADALPNIFFKVFSLFVLSFEETGSKRPVCACF